MNKKTDTWHFFATVSRMKYIERWALMRNTRPENISEHSLEVAMIGHALCNIGNVRYGKNLNAEKAALVGLYHDASEIITGDMPTPVKYSNRDIRAAYRKVEEMAENRLLEQLPEDLRPVYEKIFRADQTEEEKYLRGLVKAADKLSAYLKCVEEVKAGNNEFRQAAEQTRQALEASDLPEVAYFMEHFLPSFSLTLDELR